MVSLQHRLSSLQQPVATHCSTDHKSQALSSELKVSQGTKVKVGREDQVSQKTRATQTPHVSPSTSEFVANECFFLL